MMLQNWVNDQFAIFFCLTGGVGCGSWGISLVSLSKRPEECTCGLVCEETKLAMQGWVWHSLGLRRGPVAYRLVPRPPPPQKSVMRGSGVWILDLFLPGFSWEREWRISCHHSFSKEGTRLLGIRPLIFSSLDMELSHWVSFYHYGENIMCLRASVVSTWHSDKIQWSRKKKKPPTPSHTYSNW